MQDLEERIYRSRSDCISPRCFSFRNPQTFGGRGAELFIQFYVLWVAVRCFAQASFTIFPPPGYTSLVVNVVFGSRACTCRVAIRTPADSETDLLDLASELKIHQKTQQTPKCKQAQFISNSYRSQACVFKQELVSRVTAGGQTGWCAPGSEP